MGLFGKSFDEQVEAAIEAVRAKNLVDRLGAKIDGKVVTLTGMARSIEAKTKAMLAFNELVETENTINMIHVEAPHAAAPAPAATTTAAAATAATAPLPTAPAAPAASHDRVHVVVKGDTLSHIAKAYYGNASKYMKIFDANKDILTDPDKIQIGQKLRIPE